MSEDNLLLLRLPKALNHQLLSQWLDVHDVGKLDTAMTNKKDRPEFLQCLKEMRNPSVPDSFNGKREHDVKMLTWISARQIHVETLSLTRFDQHKEMIERLHLPSLRKLTTGHFFVDWMRHIPLLSPSLQELSVGGNNDRRTMEDFIFVLGQCLELKSVYIDSMMFQSRDHTDDVLAALQEFGHLIVEIRTACGYMRLVTTTGFMNFIKCFSRLRKLGFSYFEDNGMLLKCVAQSCPLLEELSFDTCSKPALLELSQNCKFLQKVGICRFPLTTITIAEIEVLKQIDALEDLTLKGCGLTDEKLALISGFQHLKHLKLQEYLGVHGLTGAGFRVLKGSPLSVTLQSISVSFEEGGDHQLPVQGFDIAGMVAVVASCHNLRKAHLSYHRNNAGLGVLGAGCPLLEEIKVTVGPVTVDGLVALAEHCQHLTKVVLDYDHNEGRNLEAFDIVPRFFNGSHNGPGHAMALAALPIIRSRLPHIQFECFEDFDTYYDDVVASDDDDDEDDEEADENDENDEDKVVEI